jgi:hypothetical protein
VRSSSLGRDPDRAGDPEENHPSPSRLHCSDECCRAISHVSECTVCLAKTLSVPENQQFCTISSISRFAMTAMTMVRVQLRPAEFATGDPLLSFASQTTSGDLALRQQLAVLKRRQARPKLSPFDKLFWVLACRFRTDWRRFLLVVTPETVVRWHRAGFRLHWSLISKARKQISRS